MKTYLVLVVYAHIHMDRGISKALTTVLFAGDQENEIFSFIKERATLSFTGCPWNTVPGTPVCSVLYPGYPGPEVEK